MNPEPQSSTTDPQDPAKALWGDKWFWPILEDLDQFEQSVDDFSPVDDALADDAPDWMFRAVWNCGQNMANYMGLVKPEELDSRNVGIMIGAHWSICDASAQSFPFWMGLKQDEIQKFDEAMFPGFCYACAEIARKYAEKWAPQFLKVKRKAMNLAMEHGSIEEVDYMQGYLQGSKFMVKMREKMKPSSHKRGKDEQSRNCVFLFAMCCGREIEEEKGKLSWPELFQAFNDFFENKVDIDEDAFKQILARTKLRGVGKVGRPAPIQIVTPRIPRRP